MTRGAYSGCIPEHSRSRQLVPRQCAVGLVEEASGCLAEVLAHSLIPGEVGDKGNSGRLSVTAEHWDSRRLLQALLTSFSFGHRIVWFGQEGRRA